MHEQAAESVQPDDSDPGWQDVEHDTKSLDCISQDHAGCFLPLHCQCECHHENAATEPPLALQFEVHGATQHNPELAEVLGTYAAGCRKCGWQGRFYDYTDQTRDAQRALARAEIREHKAGCDMWFEEDDRG